MISGSRPGPQQVKVGSQVKLPFGFNTASPSS